MATAPPPLGTTVGNPCLGSAPDSWGVWFPRRTARPDAELFLIVEQDLYPCAPEVPLPIAGGAREHLAGCGLSGTRRPNVDR